MAEIFESAARSAADLAGVFECDGETSYFYLYEMNGAGGGTIVDAVRITSTPPDFGKSDIAIHWDKKEQRVGLFINDVLWAMFDCVSGLKYGGDYVSGGTSRVPQHEASNFVDRRLT